MAFVAVQGIHFVKRMDLPIDPDLGVSPFPQLVEKLAVMTFPSSDERCEKVAFLAFVTLHNQVHDLLIRVADHLLPGDW